MRAGGESLGAQRGWAAATNKGESGRRDVRHQDNTWIEKKTKTKRSRKTLIVKYTNGGYKKDKRGAGVRRQKTTRNER